MSALTAYAAALAVVHLAWAYFYLCGSLVRAPRTELAGTSGAPASGAALVEIVVTTACGMALTGLVTFVAGIAHLLYPATIAVWLAVLSAAFALRADAPWRPAFWRARAALWRAAVSPGALVLYAVALLYGVGSARPDIGSDATSYHVVYPLEWANAHRIFVDLSLRVPFYATNWALLDVWLLMFRLVDAVQTLSWLASVLSLLGIYGYAMASVERTGARWAPFDAVLAALPALAVGGSIVFVNAANLGLVDVPMGFFFLASALLFADAVRTRRMDSLAAFVLCAAFFMGMKTSLIVFAPAFAAAAVLGAMLLKAPPRRIAVIVVVLGVLAAPWYAKNLVQAGDPIDPSLNMMLRGVDPHWSADDYHGFNLDLHTGEPTSLAGRFLVPLKSLTEASSPAFRADGGTLMILLLWVPALVAAYACFRPRRLDEHLERAAFAGLVVFGVGYWLALSTQSRYALVFVPALAAFLGALLTPAAVRMPRLRWPAAAALLFCAIPTAQNVASCVGTAGAYESFVNEYRDRDGWLTAHAPSYPEVEAISAALQRSGRTDLSVYRAYLEFDRLYFAERGIRVAGDLFGPERYLDFQQAIYADDMAEFVQRFHVGAFLLPTNGANVPPDQLRRVGEELTALGFHPAPVSDRFAIYLAPEVR